MRARGLHFSVDLRIHTYTEPVSLKCEEKKSPQNIRGYTDIFTVYISRANYTVFQKSDDMMHRKIIKIGSLFDIAF